MLELILKYLLDEAFVGWVILVAGLAGPPLGAALGYGVGRLRRQVRGDVVDGTLLGLFATLTLVMWHVYNAIVERLGLDTVRNLLVNLALFAVVGVVLGLTLRRVRPMLRGDAPPSAGPASRPE